MQDAVKSGLSEMLTAAGGGGWRCREGREWSVLCSERAEGTGYI